ncbi:uncharacterized protein LOC141683262 [Apium graveolens]|uniref:uncharacterized protein LOC141683262 n=1 Tax=Apium graveolens TaxID=4045 RepID=UPI003D7BD8C2
MPFHLMYQTSSSRLTRVNMRQGWFLLLVTILLVLNAQNLEARENEVKTKVFLSPKIVLGPGSVANKYYYDIDFPRGHIALKDFNAEVVDEAGNSVPLHETYLHHWVAVRYFERKGIDVSKHSQSSGFHQADRIIARNAGICDHGLTQYFGLGSETRKTATYIPDPYGIEIGNPTEIPDGYEEKWFLNVHAIDTRGAAERLGCTECRCDLYNVTVDEYNRPLSPDYVGGLYCCYDETQCLVKQGFESARRNLYMKYTVKWVDWENSILPVKIYIFDITDTWTKSDESTTALSAKHDCLIEYTVEACATDANNKACFESRRISVVMPTGGDVIYGVAHQHTGGIGSALYGEDGRVICSSIPNYGEGKEAGNEAGYIVGMSTCYPKPGSVRIADGETLYLDSNYSSAQRHTGVMGLFYILVAEPLPDSESYLQAAVEIHGETAKISFVWIGVLFGVGIALLVAFLGYRKLRSPREDGYEPIII